MNIKDKLQTLPHKPGCYLMKDEEGQIIYVGKAKDLYNRVRSYFVGSHDAKTTKLVSLIHDFEYIITSSETEAFILEMNLIKKHDPKYNILLTDDKSYPYICVTDEMYPRVLYSRDVNQKLGKYYGPYPNAKAAKEIVDMLNKMYPFRKCRVLPKRECLYYHIGQCLAPCIKKIDPKQYQEMKKSVNNILKGNVTSEIKKFEILMNEAANKLNYEKAIEYRNLINDLNVIGERQKMSGFSQDTDVFAYYANEEYVSIQVFHLRNGNMIERSGFLFDNYGNAQDIFQEFIVKFYQEQNNPIPKLIIVSSGDKEALEATLKHSVEIPIRGKKKELVKLVEDNAINRIDALIKRKELEFQRTSGANNALGELLGIDNLKVIEAFDNSNISGTNAVSAMVVFIDGKPKKNLYRKYKIKSGAAGDTQMMYEVISRRYKDPKNNPDLIIVDGGLAQVNSANKALNDLGRDLEVIGLVKDEKHRTKSILYNNEIIDIEKNSFEFRLLERIQEEVHRFAITYFHKTHSKNTFTSKLDNIKGIGKVKKQQILKILGEDNFEEKLKSLKLSETQIKEVLKLLSSN
ncbi:MAG TPA: excinuclease ABC subunit UvrC [Acholeplasmataceae bacterium]|jgi:excinuclease ABC subunit C|nr:excinuclease ABC subunit UvrC [Acholeplasmataceae bacterium]